MSREFKTYRVVIHAMGQLLIDQEKAACSPDKAIELVFQDNPKLALPHQHETLAEVFTDAGVCIGYHIKGINRDTLYDY